MSININRDLPGNAYDAAVGANSPSASNPFATISDLTSADLPHAIASGTNTYTVTIPGVIAYTDGDAYLIRFTNGNDDDSTLNINGIGAINLTKKSSVQVTGGDIVANQEMLVIYDGTNFQCVETTPNQLFAYVTNADSVTITKGQPVYAFGSAGNRMSVKLANNTGDATSAQTVGLVFSSSIAAGQKGFVITQGIIDGLNTGMYSAGDQLYLGATAGSLTNVKPYAPNHLVYLGIVERANAGNGQIYVKPQNGYELDELHDVDLISNPPTNGQVLTYDNGSGLWINDDLPATIGASINVNLEPVIENTITDPSTLSPNFGDAYLVPVGAIGTWAGQDNNIATWDGSQWLYYTPLALDITTVLTGLNAGNVYQFDGASWVLITSTSPTATPFYLAGSGVDAGGNKTSTIARTGPVVLGSNSGSIGSSPLTIRGNACIENTNTRWGMGSGSLTGLNNWYTIATFKVDYGTSKNYQILVNIGGQNANTFASVVLHINISKTSPSSSNGKAICRVVNVSGPGFNSSLGDGDYRLDESNFEFRRYTNVGLGSVAFRLYYKPTILDSFMSATVLNNNGGGTSGSVGITWNNTFLGAAIEAPGAGGAVTNYATFNYSGQRTNISAIVDPAVTDDYTLQYTVGSLWYNTVTQKVFQCLSSAGGAAVWKQITNETASSGASYLNNVVLVNSVSDLPAASGGTITLAANTVYEFNTGVFNIGANYLTISDGTVIEGQSSFNTSIVYTGAGGALRGTDVNFAARQIAFASPAGRVLDFTNVAQTKNISLQNCAVSSQTSASVITGYNIIFMAQTRFIACVGGINLINNLGIAFEFVVFNNTNSGTYITLTPTATTTAKFSDCDFVVDGVNTALNVTSTAIASGIIASCDFKGTAPVVNRLVGVNGNTAGWTITYGTNIGIAGLQFVDIEIGANVSAALGNSAGTYIDNGVKGYAIPLASYDPLATVMEARITALMTNAIGTAVQAGVYDVTTAAIVGGLGASNVGTNVAVQSNFIAITPNRDYTAYYVKAIGAATRQSIKLTLKIY